MSRFFPPSRSVAAPFDEEAEARELDEFFKQQDPIKVAAADWHTRQEQGLSPAEQLEFEQWLGAKQAHAQAYERLAHSMTTLRSLPSKAVPRQTVTITPSSAAGLRIFPRRAALAFGCLGLIVAGLGWHQWEQQRVFTQTYVVERGKQETITLPDGSELNFDTDTQAQVALYSDRREVRLLQGQVLFTVAPDKNRPFDVLAGPARVTVMGTRFSVQYRHTGAQANTVAVAVEEGHVRVPNPHASDKDQTVIDLLAGQATTISADGLVKPAATISTSSIALWRKGLLRFENTPLRDALLEMERYGPTGLIIPSPAVAAMPIGGSFQIGQPDAFAQMVTQILPVKLLKDPSGKTAIVALP